MYSTSTARDLKSGTRKGDSAANPLVAQGESKMNAGGYIYGHNALTVLV